MLQNEPGSARKRKLFTGAEDDALFENGQFGVQDPKSLQRALWWFLSLHSGWRARDESRKMCWGDVVLASDLETDSDSDSSKTRQDKMVVIKERLNRNLTQATPNRDAQLNFTKLFEVTVSKRC